MENKKLNVLILFGGRSAEHEISILSAKNVAAALDPEKFSLLLVGISQEGTWYQFADKEVFAGLKTLSDLRLPQQAMPVVLTSLKGQAQLISLSGQQATLVDVAFPVLHGTFGEDGCIQGLMKMSNLAFVGCGVFASSAGMDKEIMKRILKDAKVPTARYQLLTPENPSSWQALSHELGSPFFIKPANMGSSVGVHKIKQESDFAPSLKDAFLYDFKVLAEEFIEGREIECSVLGHNQTPKASVCGEVIPQHEFYSYEAKYLDEKGAALQIPAELSTDVLKAVQEMAKKTFSAMGCEGLTRVDFFLKKDGTALVNEINTIPGFTKISMYPKMWEATGLKYQELITELITLAREKHQAENSLKTKLL